MIYVFKDNKLFAEFQHNEPQSLGELSHYYPKKFPTDCFIYDSYWASWHRKLTRKRINLLPEKHVPKELKVICLLLGIQIGGP